MGAQGWAPFLFVPAFFFELFANRRFPASERFFRYDVARTDISMKPRLHADGVQVCAMAATLLAFAATPAAAQSHGAWAQWPYARVIDVPSTDSARLAGIVLPQEVYLHAQPQLPDLRIVDDAGNEVPYARYAREGSVTSQDLPTEITENNYVSGSYTQLVLRVGAAGQFHNAVEIRTAESDFIEWLSVEASEDGNAWYSVAERAPIFRFQRQGREGIQIVRYSPTSARFLRLRVLDGERRFPISAAQVIYTKVDAPERTFLEEEIVDDPGKGPGENAWRADLGTAALGVQEIRFAVNPAEFVRGVQVFSSDDGSKWRPVARGEIYRFHRDSLAEEHLRIDVPDDVTARYWRITLQNGSDPPLPGVVPTLYVTPVHLAFEQQPGRTYRLIYGRASATAPQYDLANGINATQEDAAVVGTLGAEEETGTLASPRGQYTAWIVVGIAGLLLGGWVAWRVARSAIRA
jgi:hypothetical protein